MICKSCRKGADYLAGIMSDPRIRLHPGDVEVAGRYHDYCKGCDCQHRVDLQAEGRSVRK